MYQCACVYNVCMCVVFMFVVCMCVCVCACMCRGKSYGTLHLAMHRGWMHFNSSLLQKQAIRSLATKILMTISSLVRYIKYDPNVMDVWLSNQSKCLVASHLQGAKIFQNRRNTHM